MNDKEFRKLVQEMRNAQQQFRRNPNAEETVRKMQRLQDKVDQELANKQKDLFE